VAGKNIGSWIYKIGKHKLSRRRNIMREFNRYLLALKFYKGVKIEQKQVDINNIPDDIICNHLTGEYIKIEENDLPDEQLDIFLKVKNAYNFNIIRTCAVVCTALIAIAVIIMLLY
jgi:hypothetical protein